MQFDCFHNKIYFPLFLLVVFTHTHIDGVFKNNNNYTIWLLCKAPFCDAPQGRYANLYEYIKMCNGLQLRLTASDLKPKLMTSN